jgi:hypothetical protein
MFDRLQPRAGEQVPARLLRACVRACLFARELHSDVWGADVADAAAKANELKRSELMHNHDIRFARSKLYRPLLATGSASTKQNVWMM